MKSKREFIGGPYVQMHFSGFWDHFLFDSEIELISHQKMNEYIDRYNIGWILVHSDRSKDYFHSMPGAAFIEENHGISIFRITQPSSFFFDGYGRVIERDFNHLELDELQGKQVTLKYHHVEGLLATPPVEIQPVYIGNDPTPFIRLINPPVKVTLYR